VVEVVVLANGRVVVGFGREFETVGHTLFDSFAVGEFFADWVAFGVVGIQTHVFEALVPCL
jgi:hypothetical protein